MKDGEIGIRIKFWFEHVIEMNHLGE